jgi:hypothetical protein
MFGRVVFRFSQELAAILVTALAFVAGWALLAGHL